MGARAVLTRYHVAEEDGLHSVSLSDDGMFELIRALLGASMPRDRVVITGNICLFALSVVDSALVSASAKKRLDMEAMLTKFVGIALDDALEAARQGTLHARVERALRALLPRGRDAVTAALLEVEPRFDSMRFVAQFARLSPEVELTVEQDARLFVAKLGPPPDPISWNAFYTRSN